MRPIVALMAMFFASSASAADGWREYVYPGLKFAVSFPAAPKIEDVDYANAGGAAIRTVLSRNADPASGDAIRFQHSFRFTDFAYQ